MLGSLEVVLLLIGKSSRQITVNGKVFSIELWSEKTVSDFRPQIVLDFAFLTRDHLDRVGIQKFLQVNLELQSRVLQLARSESVTRILTVSSGAAKSEISDLDSYGSLKLNFEHQLREVARQHRVGCLIARAWSLSGGFVGDSESLALSSFVRMAKSGRIEVQADSLVFRRYSAVEDFLAVSLWGLLNGDISEVDSGGEFIEIGELAQRVSGLVPGSDVSDKHPDRTAGAPTYYASDNVSWSDYVKQAKLKSLDLEQQIANVVASL
jgi:nucleoside-diphosphate-sugar epimerase